MSVFESIPTISTALDMLEKYKDINILVNDNDYNEEHYNKFDKLDILKICKHKLYHSIKITKEFVKFYLDMFIFHNNKLVRVDVNGFGDNKYAVFRYENKDGEVIATLHKFWQDRLLIQNNRCYTNKRNLNESYIQIEQKNINKIKPNIIDRLEGPIYNFGKELKTIFENDDSDGLIDYLIKYPKIGRYCYENISCDLSIINLAALYGAVRCFKYLILTYGYEKDEMNSFVASIGGNYEIYHICEQNNDITYNLSLKYAIKYHCNELAQHDYYNGTFETSGIIKLCLDNYNYEMLKFVYDIIN